MARITGHRTLNVLIYILYVILLLLSIAVLGITANEEQNLTNNLGCSTVPKLSYNIAAAVLSIAFFIVFLIFDNPSWSPRNKVKALKMGAWWRLLVLSIVLAIWAVASGFSLYTCADLCNACPNIPAIVYNAYFCGCNSELFAPNGDGPFGNGGSFGFFKLLKRQAFEFFVTPISTYPAKRGTDIAATVLVGMAIFVAIAMLLASDRPPPPRANVDRTSHVISNAEPGELRREEVEMQSPSQAGTGMNNNEHPAPRYSAHVHDAVSREAMAPQETEPPSYKQTMN